MMRKTKALNGCGFIGFDTIEIKIGANRYAIHPLYLLSLMALIRHESPDDLITNRAKLKEMKLAARFLTVPAFEVTGMPRARKRVERKAPSMTKLLQLCNAYICGKKVEFARLSKCSGLDRIKDIYHVMFGWALLMTYFYIFLRKDEKRNAIRWIDLGLGTRFWNSMQDRFLSKVSDDLPLQSKLSLLSSMVFNTVTCKGFTFRVRPEVESFLTHLNIGAEMCQLAEDDCRVRLMGSDGIRMTQKGSVVKEVREALDNEYSGDKKQRNKKFFKKGYFDTITEQLNLPECELLAEEARLAAQARRKYAMNAREASEYTVDELMSSPFIDCRGLPESFRSVGIMDHRDPDGHYQFQIYPPFVESFLQQTMNKNCRCGYEKWLKKHLPNNYLCGELCRVPTADYLFMRR